MARPEKPIDWNKVDQLLMAGCMGTQIAPHFDMHVNTFYEKVADHYKVSFTEYSRLKKDQGDSLLHAKQFEKAIKGDNSMLIWLGKTRLGQKENEHSTQNITFTQIERPYHERNSDPSPIRMPELPNPDLGSPSIE